MASRRVHDRLHRLLVPQRGSGRSGATRAVAVAVAALAMGGLVRCTDLTSLAPQVDGVWVGSYIEAVGPPRALDARLQLRQTGASVRGTLFLVNGRTADASGTQVGRRLTLGFRYTDACTGTARWVLDLSADGYELTGTAESFDCDGDTQAAVTLYRP